MQPLVRRTVARFAFPLALACAGLLNACSDSTAPAVLSHIAIASGNTQTGRGGVALTSPLVVRVSDQSFIQMAGVPVTFAITAGGGSLSVTSATTDDNGNAQTVYTPGTTAGAAMVTATVAGLDPVTFTATITAAADGDQ